MARVGAAISDSDSKILSQLFNPYQWYTPSVRPLPQFEPQTQLASRTQVEEVSVPAKDALQQKQQPIQQQQFQQRAAQQLQEPLQQRQEFQQQPLQQQQFQQSPIQEIKQPLQQQFQQAPLQQPLQQQFKQQPLQQPWQQPLQQQQFQQVPFQQQEFQPLQQFQPVQQVQGYAQLPQQVEFQFQEVPAVIVQVEEFEGLGKGGKFRKEGKRIPIIDYTEPPHQISILQGNLTDWKAEARNCVDKILQLNNKAYERVNQFENFKFIEGANYERETENWTFRLRRNLDNLVKENERLRAELDGLSFGKQGGGVQGGVMQGGVDMGRRADENIDFSNVLRPSEIKKAHYATEKIGQWHPQNEKRTFTEKAKDAAVGFATTVENVALHPIQSAVGLATTMENVALHPIQSVERAADAVVHTVM